MSVSTARWHGPSSVLGVAVGLLVAATPYAVDLEGGWQWGLFVAAPLVGLLLLLVPGRVRQVGTGLVASVILLPLGAVALVLLSASSEVLTR